MPVMEIAVDPWLFLSVGEYKLAGIVSWGSQTVILMALLQVFRIWNHGSGQKPVLPEILCLLPLLAIINMPGIESVSILYNPSQVPQHMNGIFACNAGVITGNPKCFGALEYCLYRDCKV